MHYGAAVSASQEMEDRDVFVVGGGNSAGQAALHLARFARSVTLLVRRPDVSATMSDYLIREMKYVPRIRIQECAEVVDGGGDGRLEWIGDPRPEHRRGLPARGRRAVPAARRRAAVRLAAARRSAATSTASCSPGATYPSSSGTTACRPANLATPVPGIFAAGDIRAGSMKRVAAASGEGASVVPLVHAHIADATAVTH